MASRLKEFRIEGLFGLYSYQIPLRLEERITIIIGPNGRGKTVCLKFIEALFTKKLNYFSDIPFRKAEFLFNGGEVISVELGEEDYEKRTLDSPSINFLLKVPEQEPVSWTPVQLDRATSREISKYIPGTWRQASLETWVDSSDGEEISFSELADRYPIPDKLAKVLQRQIPEAFAALLNPIDCHLIETQRLLILSSEETSHNLRLHYPGSRRRRESPLAIQQKAEKLKEILERTFANYANLSQSLDRTYPRRVFNAQGAVELSEAKLREELKVLDERRAALMTAGILESDDQPVALLDGNIQSGVAMALAIYLEDTNKKLDVFIGLRKRVDLFKRIVESRFVDKTLQVNRENGFKVIQKNKAVVPLDKLSSGEQHQLILIFDLLFEVSENSLILIDEPELSLHVTWQKAFIPTLAEIISLNAFDVLLATHSAPLVARHFDLAVELGPVEE